MSDRGVYRLAGAMLLQAIQDASSTSMGRRSSALRWMNGNDDSCYSFAFICRVLNRNPDEIRRFCQRKAAERRGPEPFRPFFSNAFDPLSLNTGA
jgi:hypothetical protein